MPVNSTAQKAARVLVVDDHSICRFGLKRLFDAANDFSWTGEADGGDGAIELTRQLQPDLAVVDTSLPDVRWSELTAKLLEVHPRIFVLAFATDEQMFHAAHALKAGAKGCVMKFEPVEAILEASREIVRGGTYIPKMFRPTAELPPIEFLSDRQKEIFTLLGQRRTTREIAERLALSVKTIDTHRATIASRLGFSTGKEMVEFAIEVAAGMSFAGTGWGYSRPS